MIFVRRIFSLQNKGTGTIHPCRPRMIRPGTLNPSVFTSPYVSSMKCKDHIQGLGQVKLNAQPIHRLVELCWLWLTISRVRLGQAKCPTSMGWWSSVGCDSFRDEMYWDIKTSGNNVRGHIIQGPNIRGHNVWGCIIPVPK